jgi:putative DNA primase/helicase
MDDRHNGTEWINRGRGLDKLLASGSVMTSALPNLDIERKPVPHEPVPLVRPVPAADPYPVDGLGSQLAAVVRALNDVVQSPLAMCANSVLATVTLAAQG